MSLFHVDDPDRPAWVVADNYAAAVQKWEAIVRLENDGEVGDPARGITYICGDNELIGVCQDLRPLEQSKIATKALDWEWDSESERLLAKSGTWHDQGCALPYFVEKRTEDHWQATFEGSVLWIGTLEECLAACQRSDRDQQLSQSLPQVAG